MSEMSNVPTNRVNSAGGALQVTLAGGVGQGNGGTSLPCRVVYMSGLPADLNYVTVKIGAAANASQGCTIPNGLAASVLPGPLMMYIDDIAKLYFFSPLATAAINLTYLR